MKKEQMEQETRVKCAYVPPCVEVHEAEICQLLSGTGGGYTPPTPPASGIFDSDHRLGADNTSDNNHQRGTLNNVLGVYTGSAGAKEMGIEFSDLWEDW